MRLEQLSDWGQQIMDHLGWAEGDSKRVTWTPTPRLIRYYTTLGLLDRATRFQGRVALYSSKHLLQILAIKFLQLQGRKLDEVQELLLGKNEAQLAEMLGLQLPLPELHAPAAAPPPPAPPAPSPDFWEDVGSRRGPVASPSPARPGAAAPVARTLTSLELMPGLQLLIDPARLPAQFSLERFVEQLRLLDLPFPS